MIEINSHSEAESLFFKQDYKSISKKDAEFKPENKKVAKSRIKALEDAKKFDWKHQSGAFNEEFETAIDNCRVIK